MTEHADVEQGAFELYAQTTEDSLTISPETPIEAWEQIGRTLGRMGRGVKWYIGDWLRIGEHLYGEKYSQAMEATGFEYQTLVNMRHICARVAPDTRRGRELSYAHHAEVARFETPEEQSAWLQRAIENKWTVKELRDQIKAALSTPGEDEAEEGEEEATLTKITRIAKAALNNWWEEAYRDDNFAVILGGSETAGQRDRLFAELAHSIALSCVNEGVGE